MFGNTKHFGKKISYFEAKINKLCLTFLSSALSLSKGFLKYFLLFSFLLMNRSSDFWQRFFFFCLLYSPVFVTMLYLSFLQKKKKKKKRKLRIQSETHNPTYPLSPPRVQWISSKSKKIQSVTLLEFGFVKGNVKEEQSQPQSKKLSYYQSN